MIAFFVIGPPLALALWFGLRGRKDVPMTLREFGIGAAWAIGFCFLAVFAWQAVWIGAWLTAVESDAGLARQAMNWTLVSAVIWVPVLMITYVITAQRARK